MALLNKPMTKCIPINTFPPFGLFNFVHTFAKLYIYTKQKITIYVYVINGINSKTLNYE